jgi:5-deoxy-glucuronate isomerase
MTAPDPGWLHRPSVKGKTGMIPLYKPEWGEVKRTSLYLLYLPAGEDFTGISKSRETALIILSGSIKGSAGLVMFDRLGERDSVFKGRASAFYVAPHDSWEITALTDTRIIIAAAPTQRTDLASRVITPDQVNVRHVGRDNWSREVHDVIPASFPADRLIIGETFNPAGCWSSYPPHKHDQDNLPTESEFEELYFYAVDPTEGFGIQRVYTAEGDVDVSYAVKNDDVVEIPRGYHPVVAAAGYRLYYLWILAGKGRNPVWADDPAHSWVKEK